jgi:XisI protein
MDKVNHYKSIVRSILTDIAAMFPVEENGVENQIIIDDQHGHYLLFSVGWEGKQWYYASFAHIDVKPNGRVWLQHDGTDQRIGAQLMERGVLQSDIVIGFQPPYFRETMQGYAAA